MKPLLFLIRADEGGLTMPVMDEFREERESMKQKSFKEKFQYFLDYYKWHVIGGVILTVCIISLLNTILNRKECAFYGAFINAYQTPGYETFREDFATRAGIDLEKNDVLLDTDYYITDSARDQATVNASQRLTVYVAAGDVDVMAGGPATMNQYAYNEFFQDLRQILPEDLQEQLAPYYYYVDASLVAEINAQRDSGERDVTLNYPSEPTDPDSMEEPVPAGLYIQDCPRIQEAFVFQDEEVILSVIVNESNTDAVLQFIRFIYDIEE